MRRGPGVSGLKRRQDEMKSYERIGDELGAIQTSHLQQSIDALRTRLAEFAAKHKAAINENAVFRRKFHQMCVSVGVDPLQSPRGFWSALLGFSDFYYELAVQISDVCLLTRVSHGGVIAVSELRERIAKIRSRSAAKSNDLMISTDDVTRAVGLLRELGGGYDIHTFDHSAVVVTVSMELNSDHIALMARASNQRGLIDSATQMKWDALRYQRTIQVLMTNGVVWSDEQTPDSQPQYWFYSLFLDQTNANDTPSKLSSDIQNTTTTTNNNNNNAMEIDVG